MNRSMDIFLTFHVGCPITFEAVEAVEAGLIERMGDLLSHWADRKNKSLYRISNGEDGQDKQWKQIFFFQSGNSHPLVSH